VKQHTAPVLIGPDSAATLKRHDLGSSFYDEGRLQQLIHEHPHMLPIGEIEPAFAGAVALCRELPTESGACDNVLLNEAGYLTIVECKLWRNPEARRKVVAQIVDYAKDIAAWDYDELERRVMKARGGTAEGLFALVARGAPDLDEREFVDRVQRNLSQARFLLLIVGDGIRENAEGLTEFLQRFGGYGFSLALVELPLYQLDEERTVVTPRVLMRTTEIVRSVIQVDDRRAVVVAPTDPRVESRAVTNTERIFYERLASASGAAVASAVEAFVGRLIDQLGLIALPGRGKKISLNVKSADDRFNFASIQEDGQVWFFGIVNKTEEIGAREIGEDYLEALAHLVGGQVNRTTSPWSWSVVRRRGEYLPIAEYLAHEQAWFDLIERTLARIAEHEEGS